jgi:stalled ribosome rescue protein Dom34
MAIKQKTTKKINILEGEVETLTQEQKKVIDETIKMINKKWNSNCRNLIDIGEHLLKYFYNDDPELAKARGRKKEGVSLRKLAIRPDLNVSIATLSRAFNLAVQEKQLSKFQAPQLTESHKILLLHIEDPKEKAVYAKKIVSQSISCRAFSRLLIKDEYMKQRGLASADRKARLAMANDPINSFIEPLESIMNIAIDDYDFSALPGANSKDFIDYVKKAKVVIDKLLAAVTKTAD